MSLTAWLAVLTRTRSIGLLLSFIVFSVLINNGSFKYGSLYEDEFISSYNLYAAGLFNEVLPVYVGQRTR